MGIGREQNGNYVKCECRAQVFFFHCAMLIFIVLWFQQTIVPNKTIKIKLSCCMLGLKEKKMKAANAAFLL